MITLEITLLLAVFLVMMWCAYDMFFVELEPGVGLLVLILALLFLLTAIGAGWEDYHTGFWEVQCFGQSGYTEEVVYKLEGEYFTIEDGQPEKYELPGICEEKRIWEVE